MTITPMPVRNGDPSTSHAAAAVAVTRRPRIRDAVYHVLTEDGPMTHDDLIAAYRARSLSIVGWPWASDSSIRTRCSELVRDCMVEAVPDHLGASRMGNRAVVWRAVAVQGAKTTGLNGGDA